MNKLEKICAELKQLEEDAPSFMFSFAAKEGFTTIGRSNAVHDISLVFSLINKVKRNDELAYKILLLRLMGYLIEIKKEMMPEAAPEGTMLQ